MATSDTIVFEHAVARLRPVNKTQALQHILNLLTQVDCMRCEQKCSWYLQTDHQHKCPKK